MTMKVNSILYLTKRPEWRSWLRKNYKIKDEIWLLFYKKLTKKPSLTYDEAVEEALCYGCIDSTLKRVDDEKHIQKFTPRNPSSIWSLLNKKRAEKMIRQKKMTKAGMALIQAAKKRGKWQKAYTSKTRFTIPTDLKKELQKSNKVWDNFKNFAPSTKYMYTHWVLGAKKEQTRKRRIKKVAQLASQNKKPSDK